MTCGLVHATASYRLPEWQGVKMTFFAPWRYTVFMYTCKWNPLKGVWHPSEGATLHLCISCKSGNPQKEFDIPQKWVHFIYD